jgi:hypothetical protein
MCLTVVTAGLGPAHVALSVRHRTLALSPVLTPAQRVLLARRVLAQAGQDQPEDAAEVACVCGQPLSVAGPERERRLRLAGLVAGASGG